MKKDVIVGIDIGTSSMKAIIIDYRNGNSIKNIKTDYQTCEAAQGVVYSFVYEKALIKVLTDIVNEYSPLCIGLSFQMYSMCEETSEGTLIHQWNSLWPRECEAEVKLRQYMKKSGCPVDTLYPAYKLYTSGEQGKNFVPYGLKEHIIRFLTGELVTDYSCASASGLLDIYKRNWNRELIEAMGYSLNDMPNIQKHNNIVGCINIPDTMFSNSHIPVVLGLGDGISASYACKDISKVCVNIGTSMAARAFVKSSNLNYSDKTWAYVINEDEYIVGGISSNGCSVLNWSEELKLYSEELISKSNNNLMFFPWLHGERTPYWSSDLKGTLMGIEIGTEMSSISTAVVKGVGFTVANLVNLVSRDVGSNEMVIVAGGGVHKKYLMEVVSGSISMEIGILKDSDYLASYGAAISAAEAAGISINKEMEVESIISPSYKFRDEYKRWVNTGAKVVGLYDGDIKQQK